MLFPQPPGKASRIKCESLLPHTKTPGPAETQPWALSLFPILVLSLQEVLLESRGHPIALGSLAPVSQV